MSSTRMAEDGSPPSFSVQNLTHESDREAQNGATVSQNWLSPREKWFLVVLSGFSALFSPLTANIYFPAMPTLSSEFDKSTELINLTVTMYLVFQGISPMIWGPVSDHLGRRPISAACLLLLSLSCVGLALVPTNAYWLLLFLRCFQASGSASTVAIGAGVVGDISTRAERGGLFGFFQVGPLVGPAIGPIIGGVLTEKLGWRSIFWFLVISSLVCFFTIILFQPETLRLILESGRANMRFVYRPLFPLIGRQVHDRLTSNADQISRKTEVPKNPLRIFLNLDILVLLSISAVTFTVFYGFLAPFSVLLQQSYPFLDEGKIGLCFLSVGVGTIIGSITVGKILDMEYRRFKKRSELNGRQGERADLVNDEAFPLEKARLRLVPIFALLLGIFSGVYGWCVERKVNLAVPLVLNFIAGIVTICIMSAIQTIIIDLIPDQSSSVTACNNLIRCTLGAIFVSVIDLIIRRLGIGWTYVLICGFSLLIIPLTYVAIRIGPRSRQKRYELTNR